MLSFLKPGGRIVIADLMFLNEDEKARQRDYFVSQNKAHLWNIIEDEYYTNIECIKEYSEFLGCTISYKHLVNYTWLLEIMK